MEGPSMIVQMHCVYATATSVSSVVRTNGSSCKPVHNPRQMLEEEPKRRGAVVRGGW